MALFFLAAALLVIGALALLLPVFIRREVSTTVASRTDTNVALAKAQAVDFKSRLDAGEISTDYYTEEMSRIEASLARDIEPESGSFTDDQTNKKGQWMLWPVAVAFPIAAGFLYLSIGSPQALDPANRLAPPVVQQEAPRSMEEVVSRIQQHLEKEPDDPKGWFMLGLSYLNSGSYKQAEEALRKSVEIDSSNVDAKVRLADAIALTQNGSLLGEPTTLLASAIKEAPDHPHGLWLHGMAVNEAGNPKEAIAVWTRLKGLVSTDPEASTNVAQLIANAERQLGITSNNVVEAEVVEPASSEGTLEVQVSLKEGLAEGLAPDTAVFVYAKAVSGPPMPLAVVKLTLAELPLTVTLSDAQAMIETMKISAFTEVIVGARISKTGNPIAQSGDYFIEVEGVDTESQLSPLKIVISETLP